MSGPGDDALFATPAINGLDGDEVRYIFLNGVNTNANNSTAQISELNIFIDTGITSSGMLTYEWSPTTGLSNPNIENPIVSPTMTTTYVVTVTDENGCSSTDDIIVNVNDVPIVTDIAVEDATCGLDNGSITISFDEVPSIAQLEFSLDGGFTWEAAVSGAAGTLTYDNLPAGIYDLYVRDPATNCSEYLNIVSISNQLLEVEAGEDQLICSGESADISASGGVSYQWDDPAGSTTATATVMPTSTTVYTVTIIDANGCETIDQVLVVVNDPAATISDPIDQCVDGSDMVFSATPVPGTVAGDSGEYTPLTGLVDNGDGTATLDVDVAGPGTYTIEYTYSDDNGCPAVATTEVTVYGLPIVDAGIDATICEGDTTMLDGRVEVGYANGNFQLINSTLDERFGGPENLFNDIDDTGARTIHVIREMAGQDWGIAYSLDGAYEIEAISLDRRNDCCTNRGHGGVIQILNGGVVVYESDVVTAPGNGELFASPAIANISGDEVRYIFKNGVDTEVGDVLNFAELNIYLGDPNQGLSYEWSPATGLSDPTVADPLAFPTTTTTYTLTVTNEHGCTATDEVTINVNEAIDASALVVQNDYCEDGSGEVTVTVLNGMGPFTIEWQTTEGTEQGSDSISNPGDYIISGLNGGTTYCIEVTDANGCKVLRP